MRRGVSILEVMIAILVVSVGLLAALTVFPVAAHFAKKGEIADSSSILGRTAVHRFDAHGMRQPRWMVADPATPGAFLYQSPVFNQCYCIDPRGFAANFAAPLPNAAFPYSAVAGQPFMVRVTLDQMAVNAAGQPVLSGLPLSRPAADSIFKFADDFTVVRPDDGSMPAFGTITQIDSDNDGTVDLMTSRSTGGHYTWMATLVPKHELYSPPAVVSATDYLLSIVVFYDRPGDMLAGDVMHERVINVDFADAGGFGFAGGEVYLTWDAPQSAANDAFARDVQLHLRAGEWICLGRMVRHVLGGPNGTPFPSFRWYKVAECDSQPEYHAAENHYAIAASLAGSDWDVTDSAIAPAAGSDPTIAVLMEGVVAVYEKTVRLEPGIQ